MKLLAPRSIITLTAAWFLIGAGSASAATIPVSFKSVTPQAPVPGDTVSFEAQTNAMGPLTWYWNFDYAANHNAFQQGTATATHQYTKRGSYYVIVYVTDGNGNSGFASRQLAVGHQPQASFTVDPGTPAPGQTVTFTSTSVSPDEGGQIKTFAWDLNNDGNFDEGTASTATRSFDADGQYTVALKVTDDMGYTSTHTETFNVATPAPAPDQSFESTPSPDQGASPPPDQGTVFNTPITSLAQFKPIPFIHIKGHTTGRGAQIDLFTVRAAGGARVAVRCVGKKCTKKRSASRHVKGSKTRTLRFRAVEGWLRAGIVVEVRVTKQGFVGRYTRFRIGKVKPPVRWDGCLMPGKKNPVEC